MHIFVEYIINQETFWLDLFICQNYTCENYVQRRSSFMIVLLTKLTVILLLILLCVELDSIYCYIYMKCVFHVSDKHISHFSVLVIKWQ